MRQDVVRALQEVRLLLHDVGWTKRCYARGPDGCGVHVTDPSAISFCLQGAVQRACAGNDLLYYHTMSAINDELARRKFMGSLQLFNDEAEDVMDILLMLSSIVMK